jgi:ribosomal protein S27AE
MVQNGVVMDQVISQDVLDAAQAALDQTTSYDLEEIMDHCPRCHSCEMSEDEDVWYCLVCGYYLDVNEGDNPYHPHAPLPHYSIGYRHDDPLFYEKEIEDDGCMPDDDLSAAESWLQDREQAGYMIAKCVLVNEHGHVIWLRGSPCDWNFSKR